LTIGVQAQIDKGFSLSLSSGITTPIGDYQKYTKLGGINEDLGYPIDYYGYTKERTGKSQFNIDASYQFGGLGMGLSFGKFKHEVSSLAYDIDFPTLIQGGEIDGLYYGIGPNYAFSLGKLKMISSVRVGKMNFDLTNFTGSYNGDDTTVPVEILTTTQNPKSETALTYSSFGIKFSYPVLKKVSLFIKADYFSTFGDGLQMDDSYYLPFNLNESNEITIDDVGEFTLPDFLKTESRFIKPQMYNLGVGLSFTLGGKKKNKKPAKNTNIKQEEKPQQKEGTRKIVLTYPENGAQFNDGKTFKNFKWKIVGKEFINPKYVIEVRPLDGKKGTLIAFSPKENVDFKKVFKDVEPNGLYTWRVVEQKTGTTSGISMFNKTSCVIDLQLINVESECLGYEGANRKFKICFDVTYQDSNDDLTYNNPSSGLFVNDQVYNALTYNLVGTNATLQTQIGNSTTTTMHYCFETLVDSTVTEIGFVIQGDDINPHPIAFCLPGANDSVEELPSCLCDECDEIEITFNKNSITQATPPPSQSLTIIDQSIFTFDGTINVNAPIYGIEFQIVSLNYSSYPSACSNGITSIEESGMFLQAGTTINNSTSIQFNNENTSQSPNSNTNASKNIKYTSNGALNGNTSFNLNIGVPKPIQGLDAGCCQINYEICIKANVFYEDGTCKTCTLTKCFNFNNQ